MKLKHVNSRVDHIENIILMNLYKHGSHIAREYNYQIPKLAPEIQLN